MTTATANATTQTGAAVIRRAYTDRNGACVQQGWDIFVGGEWGNRYALLRDAKAACRDEGLAFTVAK